MKTQDNEPDIDPFLCRCSKCKRFWKKAFSGEGAEELFVLPSEERAAKTSMMYTATRQREDHPAVLKIGDRVCYQDELKGVVKFVGILDENTSAPDSYVGIKADDNIHSRHNGIYKGKRYFHCPRGHGLMASYADVIRINPPEPKPPLSGNDMYPSYRSVRKKRLERSLRDPKSDALWDYKPKPPTFISDENDVAAKDLVRQQQRQKKRLQLMAEREKTRKEREDAASRQNFLKWKEQFGGGKKGERLAKTLQNLHVAYEKGLRLEQETTKEDDNLSFIGSDNWSGHSTYDDQGVPKR